MAGGGGGSGSSGAEIELNKGSLVADAASLSVAFAAKKNLRIKIDVVGLASGGVLVLQFNNDNSVIYDCEQVTGATVTLQNTNGTFMYLYDAVSTSEMQFELVVRNVLARNKKMVGVGYNADNVHLGISGRYKNTAAQITSCKLFVQGGQNLKAGTNITVLGFDE